VKRAVVWLSAYACLFAVLFGGYQWWQGRSAPPPLDGGPRIGVGGAVEVGQPYSWGAVVLQNRGGRPAVVQRARILRSTPNLELAGPVHSHFVGYGHTEADQMIAGDQTGFPPARWPSRPLAEQNIVRVAQRIGDDGEPTEGLQIVFGLVVTAPGEARATAVEVVYRVGGRRYRQVFDNTVTLCAPVAVYLERDCPADEARLIPEDRILG
jgi:hypothetical protein